MEGLPRENGTQEEELKKDKDADWARAKKLCRLSAEDVRMAKELGFQPKSLIKNNPSPSQRWKAPVRVWVQDMYAKRFPDKVYGPPIRPRRPSPAATRDERPPHPLRLTAAANIARAPYQGGHRAIEHDDAEASDERDDPFLVSDDEGPDDDWLPEPPEEDTPDEANRRLLRQHDSFLAAADYVTAAWAQLDVVQRVVLFGSLARPPHKIAPHRREFRRAGVMQWYECKDVDLAVWVSDVGSLKTLQRARAHALDDLLHRTGRGVAHHQIDVFVMESGSDRHLGRLCNFGECPKRDKRECRVPGCGAALFLRQLEDFTLEPSALAPQKIRTLFDRAQGIAPPSLERWENDDDVPF